MIKVENNSVCNERLNNQLATQILCPSVVKKTYRILEVLSRSLWIRIFQGFSKDLPLKDHAKVLRVARIFAEISSKILAGSLSKIFEHSQGSLSGSLAILARGFKILKILN